MSSADIANASNTHKCLHSIKCIGVEGLLPGQKEAKPAPIMILELEIKAADKVAAVVHHSRGAQCQCCWWMVAIAIEATFCAIVQHYRLLPSVVVVVQLRAPQGGSRSPAQCTQALSTTAPWLFLSTF